MTSQIGKLCEPVEDALDVRRRLAVRIGEHHGGVVGTPGSHGDEELVDGHRGVHRDFAPVERRQGDLPDGIGSFIREEFGEAFDSHAAGAGKVGLIAVALRSDIRTVEI